jgi:16S rRNA processing protein RimM
MSIPDDLVLVGHVTGAYGIHGWVRIKPYSPDADAMLQAKTWWLDKPELHDVDMMQAKIHGEDVVAQLMGVADRNAAELLKGTIVQVRRSHFPALSDGEFYWVDLIGLAVENLHGECLGSVSDLMDNGAHPILRVQTPSIADTGKPKELLIPFVDQFVKTVDQAGKKITVDWGLDY